VSSPAKTASELETITALEQENAQLRTALESRIVIEQAKGALSVRHGLDPDDAFALLRRHARNHRRDIHMLAAEVVQNQGRLPGQ
jgi:AmiR/NasT family two-component response regulator